MRDFFMQRYIVASRGVVFCVLMSLSAFASASLQTAIDDLLDKAGRDLKADRLMRPVNKNAVDRYRAVLLLDAGNQRAALGLRQVVKRYLVLAQSQSEKGAYVRARSFVASAERVNGRSAQITAVRARINKAERDSRLVKPIVSPKVPPVAKVNPIQTVFNLNPADLSARNSAMVSELSTLARRVRLSREYVLIYARNDAEGRWIYQQMRKASPNYRLRGDIKRSKTPRVILDKPLDE